MNSARLRRFIEAHEGRRVNAYVDSRGIPTIGVGFNLTRPDAKDKIAALGLSYEAVCRGTVSLTDVQIHALLDLDIAAARAGARRCVQGFDTLPLQAQMVIIDTVFNLGVGGFSTFRKMIAAMERRDWTDAAKRCAIRSGITRSAGALTRTSPSSPVVPFPRRRPGAASDRKSVV